jgi:hypothetical protein
VDGDGGEAGAGSAGGGDSGRSGGVGGHVGGVAGTWSSSADGSRGGDALDGVRDREGEDGGGVDVQDRGERSRSSSPSANAFRFSLVNGGHELTSLALILK